MTAPVPAEMNERTAAAIEKRLQQGSDYDDHDYLAAEEEYERWVAAEDGAQ